MPNLYFLGLGWLSTWVSGIADDARHVVENIARRVWPADLSRTPQKSGWLDPV